MNVAVSLFQARGLDCTSTIADCTRAQLPQLATRTWKQKCDMLRLDRFFASSNHCHKVKRCEAMRLLIYESKLHKRFFFKWWVGGVVVQNPCHPKFLGAGDEIMMLKLR